MFQEHIKIYNLFVCDNCSFKKYRFEEFHKVEMKYCKSTLVLLNKFIMNKSTCVLHAAGIS